MIQTDRLQLRRISADDAAFILELLNEPAYIRNIGDRGLRTLEDARRYIADKLVASYEHHGFGLYAVELRHGGGPLGISGLVKRDSLPDVDIGYAFLQRHWGRGYALEAARAVWRHAQEDLGLKRLVAITAPDNEPSMALLRKIGMRFEKILVLPEGESAFFSAQLGAAR
ncbi:MAG: GNAT family N-acetyltransferase [Pseudomonadota bacterium]